MASEQQISELLATFWYSRIFFQLCGVILHLLLLVAFVRDPLKCFRNLNICLIVNLTAVDFLHCVIEPLRNLVFIDDKRMNEAYYFLIHAFITVSFLSMASISIDRLLMITYPIRYRYWVSGKVMTVWLLFQWILGIAYSTIRFIKDGEEIRERWVYVGLLTVPAFLSSIGYLLVCRALKKQRRNIIEQIASNRNQAEEIRLLKEKKFLQTFVLIATLPVVSVVPFWFVLNILQSELYSPENHFTLVILLCIFGSLSAVNYAINPLVYFLRFPNYRKTFKILYGRR